MENEYYEAKKQEALRVALKASLLNQIKTTFTRRSGDLESRMFLPDIKAVFR
jgi:hypothetical protein